MNRKLTTASKIALALGASLLMISPLVADDALTLDQILAKNYEARGGLDKLRGVESMRATGNFNMQGMELAMTIEAKAGKVRNEVVFQGNSMIQVVDGEEGWMINPMTGSTEPQKMPADMLKTMSEQTDLSGPLVDWKDKGHTVELIGREDVEGTDAYHLKVTLDTGDVNHVFLDADHFIEFQGKTLRTVNGQEIDGTTTFGDYKEVDGLMVAHSIETSAVGMPFTQSIQLNEVEFNIDIDDARFEMPEAAPAATGTDG